ncbi:reverse transcriptase domain-containing protein, partial [Tanacetum coccineum]
QLDMDQYAQYHEYFEQYESLEGDDGESSVCNSERLSRRYIPRERELAEEKLRRDYFGDENTPPIYPEEYFRRRIPGMLGSIDCMHWEWTKRLKALHGQFKRRDKKYPTIMLEAVADQQLWSEQVYFGVPGVPGSFYGAGSVNRSSQHWPLIISQSLDAYFPSLD